MREKLKDSGGVTLVEMLCAVVILILLGLMLNTGLQMAVKSYREITAESETQLLLNSLVDAIAGELRCAHEVTGSGAGFTYNGGRSLSLSDGQVVVDGQQLLPTDKNGKGGAYHGGAYRVTEMNITYDKDESCFTITDLRVEWKNGNISAETPAEGVFIRCLNPPLEEPPEEPGPAAGG